MKKLLVTGAAGLIGSEVVAWFSRFDWDIVGVDNNMRAGFFRPQRVTPPGIRAAWSRTMKTIAV